eukprot:CAMPEP_0197070122 /NCGR_PEP_ID=MMETSP1384-20130603/197697_1 /TAXON_ID=29189 /ORGANISM="Ammonia sp." /LENGTH=138 /DNA_ID=CAMNT_0042508391 /DNA_START=58 /DNA_END=470 /DNA_ORIENTATION=+
MRHRRHRDRHLQLQTGDKVLQQITNAASDLLGGSCVLLNVLLRDKQITINASSLGASKFMKDCTLPLAEAICPIMRKKRLPHLEILDLLHDERTKSKAISSTPLKELGFFALSHKNSAEPLEEAQEFMKHVHAEQAFR